MTAIAQLSSRRVAILAFALLVLLGFSFHLYSPERISRLSSLSVHSFSSSKSTGLLDCSPDIEHLRTLELTPEIRYSRADIVVRQDASPHDPQQQLDVPLPAFRSLLPNETDPFERNDGVPYDCVAPITLSFPKPPPRPDLSYITFGLATTLERMEDSMDAFAHWIAGTNAVMIAYLEPDSKYSPAAGRLRAKASRLGFTLDIQESDLEHMDRYFALVRVIYERRTPQTKWAVILDDDTFFMSANKLDDLLRPLDHHKPYYIGGITDSFQQSTKFGIIGSGGASIMLSFATLEELYPDEVYGRCLANNLEDQADRFNTIFSTNEKHFGDIMIANCIYLHTTIKFTIEHTLHQLDMRGDLSGVYEGFTTPARRTRPLTLHHWKSWHTANVTLMAAVAPACGDACVLQRWKFANGWWLTNGFSLVKYSEDIPIGDITIERTWDETDDYRHSFTPLRRPDKGKISLRAESVQVERGRIRQYYIRRKNTEGMKEVAVSKNSDEVFELVWHFEPPKGEGSK